MNGAVNFLKPPGMTSSDAVVWLRWVLKQKKCGHGGTLDPAACGVLPVLVGSGTKLFDRMLGHEKTYAATIRFGASTDTLDAQGAIISRTHAIPDDAALRASLPHFTGSIEQIPPQYSAVRIDGRHAYELARKGEVSQMPTRSVHIHSISDPKWLDERTATIRVRCSSGTYIRTLAADIAAHCGSLAYLCALTREQSGMFSLDEAWTVESLLALREQGCIQRAVTPIADLLADIPACHVDESERMHAINGAAIALCMTDRPDLAAGEQTRLLTDDGTLIGVARVGEDGALHMQTMLYRAH